jgi:hypothetical protein
MPAFCDYTRAGELDQHVMCTCSVSIVSLLSFVQKNVQTSKKSMPILVKYVILICHALLSLLSKCTVLISDALVIATVQSTLVALEYGFDLMKLILLYCIRGHALGSGPCKLSAINTHVVHVLGFAVTGRMLQHPPTIKSGKASKHAYDKLLTVKSAQARSQRDDISPRLLCKSQDGGPSSAYRNRCKYDCYRNPSELRT